MLDLLVVVEVDTVTVLLAPETVHPETAAFEMRGPETVLQEILPQETVPPDPTLVGTLHPVMCLLHAVRHPTRPRPTRAHLPKASSPKADKADKADKVCQGAHQPTYQPTWAPLRPGGLKRP